VLTREIWLLVLGAVSLRLPAGDFCLTLMSPASRRFFLLLLLLLLFVWPEIALLPDDYFWLAIAARMPHIVMIASGSG
jgi:hypothetical protein